MLAYFLLMYCVADVALGAVVSKTTSIGSNPVFGDANFKGKVKEQDG